MRKSVQAIIIRLETIIEQVEEYKDNAEQAEYPNDDRIDKLEVELDRLQEALEALQDIE